MAFQKKVNLAQGLGNIGQIAKSYHGFLNVVDYVASSDISVGEFVMDNEGEALSTKGREVTSSLLGVVVRDSLKADYNEIKKGQPVTIINEGCVFIEGNGSIYRGDKVVLDKNTGEVVFTTSSSQDLLDTGWRVFRGNELGLGVVGIDAATRSQAERPAEPKAEVGDLLLKSGAWVKADEVTSEHALNAEGVLVYVEPLTNRGLLADIALSEPMKFCLDTATWWSNQQVGLSQSKSATNAGGNAPSFTQNLYQNYKICASLTAGDDLEVEGKYPAFDYAKQRGGGWFIPNLVTASYINRNVDKLNATISKLGLTAFSGNVWTTTGLNEAGLKYHCMLVSVEQKTTEQILEKMAINSHNGNQPTAQRTSENKILLVKAVNV